MPDAGRRGSVDRTVHIRCHELAPAIADLDANLRMIDAAVADAMGAGVQLLVLPELATSGYTLTPEEARATALPGTSPVLDGWAAQLADGAVLVLGFCEVDGDQLYNSAAVITRRGVLGVHRKVHLWDSEKEIFTPGGAPAGVLDTPLGPLGTLVCYDLEFPEMPRGLALAGAEIIAVPTNWPLLARPPGEHAPEVIQAMAAARASQVAIACCDRRGTERGVTWTQGTTIVSPDGWPCGEKDRLGRLDVAVELKATRTRIGARNDVYGDRRPGLYAREPAPQRCPG